MIPLCCYRSEQEVKPGWWGCSSPLIQVKRDGLMQACVCIEEGERKCPHRNQTTVSRGPAPQNPVPARVVKQKACIYLGEQIGFRECSSCGGKKTRFKEFACSHPAHGKTTLPDCQQCGDYTCPTGPTG